MFKIVEVRKNGITIETSMVSESLQEAKNKAEKHKKDLYRNNYHSNPAVAVSVVDYMNEEVKRYRV